MTQLALDPAHRPFTRHARLRPKQVRPEQVRPASPYVVALLMVVSLAATLTGCGEEVRIPTAKTFALPPILQPQMDGDIKVFDLKMQRGSTVFLPGTRTATLGINGDLLGPVVVVKRGDKVRMQVENAIGEETTLHWHGLHIPAKMDGGPHQSIAPGETWKPTFTIDNRAGLYWFHPHLEGTTGSQVYRGLAGLMIIQDDEEAKLALPRTYGVDDFPLIIQDRRFTADGKFSYLSALVDHTGMRGPNVLINGKREPPLTVPAQVVRLRVLNGSNARPYLLGLSTNTPFQVIASDGGLLRKPVTVTRLPIYPGERYELLVDFKNALNDRKSGGKALSLKSYSAEMGLDYTGTDAVDASNFDLLHFTVGAATTTAVTTIPTTLSTIATIPASSAVRSRSFVVEMQTGGVMTINGNTMKMDRIDETVLLGDTELWTFRNQSMAPHPIHIHDVQFQVVSRSRGGGMGGGGGSSAAVPAWESGWKDTVVVPAMSSVTVIATFEDFADPDVPFMYHCHILEHEDRGMMGQFIVKERN